jgi:hypothetical protein
VNGKHEVRLERIEERIDKLHDKMDELSRTRPRTVPTPGG